MKPSTITLFSQIARFLVIIIFLAIMWTTTGCQLPSVTVHGQYGDYTFKPRQPVTIAPAK